MKRWPKADISHRTNLNTKKFVLVETKIVSMLKKYQDKRIGN